MTAYLIFDDNIFKKLIFPVKWVTCHHGTVGPQVADGDKWDQCVRPRLSDWFPYLSNRFLARGLLMALMMKAVRPSETSVNFYQTTRRNNPEDSHLRKSHVVIISSDYISL
jgi:hypothetical protein